MKVAVIGNAGRLGDNLCKQALSHGYSIALLGANQPQSVQFEQVCGDLSDANSLEAALTGVHAVVVLPGSPRNLNELAALVQTMHAFYIRRLIIAADLYQREPQAFEQLLQKANIDWTLIHYAEAKAGFGVADADFAKYVVRQITEVANVRSALMVAP